MRRLEEESKGSTSGEESLYDSDTNPPQEVKKSSRPAKAMPGTYLSTNLITEKKPDLS